MGFFAGSRNTEANRSFVERVQLQRILVLCSLHNGVAISYFEQTTIAKDARTGVGLRPPEPYVWPKTVHTTNVYDKEVGYDRNLDGPCTIPALRKICCIHPKKSSIATKLESRDHYMMENK